MNRTDFDLLVQRLSEARDRSGNPLRLTNLTVSTEEDRFSFDFGEAQVLTDLRSISKVILSMTIGIAIDRGVRAWGGPLTTETKIYPLLEPCTSSLSRKARSALKDVRLSHLLTNTMGHDEGFLFRKDIGDRDMSTLLRYITEQPITHRPGTHFSYSNVGPYLTSVLIQEAVGVQFDGLANELLLGPLGIPEFEWAKYGNYVAGCSGLSVLPSDLHKLGQVLISDGVWNGSQIVPTEWVRRMRSPLVPSPEKYEPHRTFPKFAYRYGLWVTGSGNYYCDGAAGQYLIVVPTKGLVISTTGHQDDMKPITGCMRPLV